MSMDKLDKLITSFSAKGNTIRVGILDDSPRKDDKSLNNPTLGAIHEFGTAKIPARSFIRIPLMENLQGMLQANASYLGKSIENGDLPQMMTKVAELAADIVSEAFDSQGYGKWAPNQAGTTPLVDTGQLRASISYDFKGDK